MSIANRDPEPAMMRVCESQGPPEPAG